MIKELFAGPVLRTTLSSLALAALLAMSACSEPPPTPEPELAPTATLIPTLAPFDTPLPVATEVPAETPATSEAATEASADATPVTEAVSGGEAITTTEGITGSTETSTTEEAAAPQESPEDESDEATVVITATVVTATVTIATTGDLTGSHSMTEEHGMSEEHGMVAGASTELSPTTAISGSESINVFFLQPTTNANVPLTFTVEMSYTGVTVADASESVEGGGHLQILVDAEFIEAGQPIPADESHIHYNEGQTSAELSLTPGSHILRLQYADNNHLAMAGDPYEDRIIVNVVDGAAEEGVRFVSPTAGATVPPEFEVTMAATALSVLPAGTIAPDSGHFHVLIDTPFIAAGEAIPSNESHIHLGKAQLTTTLTLEPGTHLLRLQFADANHIALAGDQYRAEVEVIVEEDAPENQVMFIKPGDGATVNSPFLVAWAASGLIIEPAGADIRPEAGHLHILIDEDFVPAGEAIPTDASHLHFGKGQTQTELTLEPGEHTLRLQMATGAHIAHDGSQYQDEITVIAK